MDPTNAATDDRARWDHRYSSGDYEPRRQPSRLVERAISYVAPGNALVLACGVGRNALRLAAAGFDVTAVDVSPVAIAMAREEGAKRGLDVDWRVADVGQMTIPPDSYDLITMIRYVNRRMWPQLVDALTPNGWILMEQHLRTHREVIGPGSDFRLDPGELLRVFSGLRIIEYSELVEPSDRGDEMVATSRLAACKGDPGW